MTKEVLERPGVYAYRKLTNPAGLDAKYFLGALGMSGMTAYSSFYELAKAKKGEVLWVSAASGAVGQIVGQLGKREGMKVIGSVGSEEKLRFIREELGFDAGFCYKSEGVEEGLKRCLKEVGAEKVDVYFDNVGGETLDIALLNMNVWGRIRKSSLAFVLSRPPCLCGGMPLLTIDTTSSHPTPPSPPQAKISLEIPISSQPTSLLFRKEIQDLTRDVFTPPSLFEKRP